MSDSSHPAQGASPRAAALPHVAAFPRALGCGIIIRSVQPVPAELHARITSFIDSYEAALSRFRPDSLVSAMAHAPHGGAFDFPEWTLALFQLYDRLTTATDGAIDPCVGEDLVRLGYGTELGDALRNGTSPANASLPPSPQHTAAAQRNDTPSQASQASQAASPRTPTTYAGPSAGLAPEDPDTFTEGGAYRGHNAPTTCPQRHHSGAKLPTSPHTCCTDTQSSPASTPQSSTLPPESIRRAHAMPTLRPQRAQSNADLPASPRADSCIDSYAGHACAQSQPSIDLQPSTPMSRTPNPTPPTWDSLARRNADHPTWQADVERHGTTLVTRRPVWLDFGAAGKGYLVDFIAALLREHGLGSFVIDAGGDLRVEGLGSEPLRIALEDPADVTRAIGLACVGDGSLCASSPSRRHWAGAHHLINALDGRPANDVAAAWAFVAHKTAFPQPPASGSPCEFSAAAYPTALADGLATALFVADPTALRRAFPYECLILDADRTARRSPGFPGTVFTR